MQTTVIKAIGPANIAALAAIVEAAQKTGQIDTKALVKINESVDRHAEINEIAAYLRGKELTGDEKRKITNLLKSIERKDAQGQRIARSDLIRMADPFYRGDMVQLLSRLAPLVTGGRMVPAADFAIDHAKRAVNSPTLSNLGPRTRALKECADRLKVGGDLATIRADKPT